MGLLNFTGKTVLGVLLLAFLAIPLAEKTGHAEMIEGAMISLILMAGILAVGGRRGSLLIAGSLGGLAILARWVHAAAPHTVAVDFHLALGALTVGFVVWRFLVLILFARRVNADVLCSAIAAFFLMAILWSLIYQLIDIRTPGSFAYNVSGVPTPAVRGEFALYFSLVTLCTVGFGDLVPTSHIARMAVMLEGVAGVFYVAVLVSRLVSLHTAAQQAEPAPEQA